MLIMRLFLASSILLSFAFIFQPSSLLAEEKKELKINGASTVRPIVTVAARVYGKARGIKIKVDEGGSSVGVKSIGEGTVDLGMASRYLKPEEKKKYPRLVPHLIGFDGVAMIVNAKNPLTAITKDQVQKIFTGKIVNWKELGGPDAAITLISKEEGRSTLDLFNDYFDMEVKTVNEKIFYRVKGESQFATKAASIIGANSGALVKVGEDVGAIGYVSIGSAERAELKTGHLKRLQLDGVAPTRQTVRDKTYPILRPLTVLSAGEPSGAVKGFIDYLLSQPGQNIVKNLDYIPISE
jgi:phosphate transport system substrate-binding protein